MEQDKTTMIETTGITKIFVSNAVETRALQELSFTIATGEYVAISGPSGCGKSTLLSILGLIDTPTRGIYRFRGKAIGGLSLAEKARLRNQEIGFIFQNFNLIGDLSLYQNVELPLMYRLGMHPEQRRIRVLRALERVGIEYRADHYPAQVSGGQQQRAAVARALVNSPSLILADEPTGNLDSKNGEAVMEILKELHRTGTTVCVVTHSEQYAGYAERQISLLDGEFVGDSRAGVPRND